MESFELSPLMVVVLLLASALGGVTVLKIFRLPTLPAYFLPVISRGLMVWAF